MRRIIWLAAVLGVVTTGARLQAAPLITVTGGTATPIVNGTLGFNFFTGANPVVIHSLGFFDAGDDGLATAHNVGIWTADGSTLLASAVVPAGTTATLDSGFRFVAIAPVVLPANTEFLAGALNVPGADGIIRFASATTDPSIILGSTRFNLFSDPTFSPPVFSQGTGFDDGYFGPNFNGNAQPADVPEPATLALFGLMAVGGAGYTRRRMKATA
jgi:hypothetical protein